MTRPVRIHIDTDALQHNLHCVKKFAPHSKVIAMVKANAYGHGLCDVAAVLSDADALGVACIEEAKILRVSGIKKKITLMEGFFDPIELPQICELGLSTVVHHMAQVKALENVRLPSPIGVWIKIDSGMHRLGFAPDHVDEVWQRLKKCAAVKPRLRLMTHFADADTPEKKTTDEQWKRFQPLISQFSAEISVANSAAILTRPETHGEWVRPGIMLYGISPFMNKSGDAHELKPVMTVSSQIIAVRQLHQGDAIGYGGSWTCPESMPVGVVAMGYGDGYPRHALNGTPVLVNGEVVPLVGRISMDMLAVDLRTQPHAKVGDPVVLWGKGLPIERVAQHAQTIPYELLCNMKKRC